MNLSFEDVVTEAFTNENVTVNDKQAILNTNEGLYE